MLILVLIIVLIALIIVLIKNNNSKFEDNKNHDTLLSFFNKYNTKIETINNKVKIVDCVYCITMPDRKEYIMGKMKELNLSYKLVNAIKPEDIKEYYSQLTNTHIKYGKKTLLALQMSYVLCMIDSINNNYDNIIIFEDDITIETDLNTLKNSISEFINSNFVFFYLGYCYMNCNQNFNNNYSYLLNVPDKNIACTHAIVYKVKYFKELLNTLFFMEEAYDHMLLKFIKKYNYSICVPHKVYFNQKTDFPNSINNNNAPLPVCSL